MSQNNLPPLKKKPERLADMLQSRNISRRAFLKYAAWTASVMALPPAMAKTIAENLPNARRRSVIWLSFQECTGCSESMVRIMKPSLEDLIFNYISMDYWHLLHNSSGAAAKQALAQAMEDNKGEYIVIVEGSIPMGAGGAYSTGAGISNVDMLKKTVEHAAVVIAVGSCSAFGGIPYADPNPTDAVAVTDLVKDKPIINLPGCPPIPEVMAGTLSYILAFNKLPEMDHLHRPLSFYGESIHERCYRRPFYDKGLFAKSIDDEGARKGWCLYDVGCKGPTTYNSCATMKWNGGVSFPIQSGHGCLGCSEPNFWDLGSFYKPLGAGIAYGSGTVAVKVVGAAAAGVALGAAAALQARKTQKSFITKTEEENQGG